jgi:antitoxin (DNA-binding transcriptional repressor) of toxin-antitoxin stability system
MKKANVRDIRYSFPRIVRWLREGESIEITYRNRQLARLIPAGPPKMPPPEMPDWEARLKRLFPDRVKGKPASEIIHESRDR